jgi:hypothetical protein
MEPNTMEDAAVHNALGFAALYAFVYITLHKQQQRAHNLLGSSSYKFNGLIIHQSS